MSSAREAAKQLSESFRDVVEVRFRLRHDMTLVGPDGYIAYSARSGDGITALKSVRSLLELQNKLDSSMLHIAASLMHRS
jgi:hypothetical protein